MNAYSELYIDDAACNLGEYLDYMVIDLKYDIDAAFYMFANSNIGHSFEVGNPAVVTGISGVEMAWKVLYEIKGYWENTNPTQTIDRSEEYWVGWSMAQYQWARNTTFMKMIDGGVSCLELVGNYILHEADITKVIANIDLLIENRKNESALKRIRKYANMTQKMLSEKSGVSLRMIQLYEQGQNDITHAQVNVVRDLAHTLGCNIEDLL